MLTNDVFLIGDIGGTHTNFEVIQFKDGFFNTIYKKELETQKIKNFTAEINIILNKIVTTNRVVVENCVLSCAGLISNGNVKLSNSNLIIDSDEIQENTSIKKIDLINDLISIAYSISSLKEDNFKKINDGQKGSKKIVIGVGTGFNISYIDSFEIIPSEIGHASFATLDEKDFELVKFLKKILKKDSIEVEDIISGRGIENLYKFLSFTKKQKDLPKTLTAYEISTQKNKNKLAKETLNLFYFYLARITRNIALIFLPDEIYFAGGVIENNIVFSKKDFLTQFSNHKKFSSYLKKISISIIKDYSCSMDGLKNYIIHEK